MQLIVGLVILILGVLVVRGCVRSYLSNLESTVRFDFDLRNYLTAHAAGVLVGTAMALTGALVILMYFHNGLQIDRHLEPIDRFPFVKARPAEAVIPRPL